MTVTMAWVHYTMTPLKQSHDAGFGAGYRVREDIELERDTANEVLGDLADQINRNAKLNKMVALLGRPQGRGKK